MLGIISKNKWFCHIDEREREQDQTQGYSVDILYTPGLAVSSKGGFNQERNHPEEIVSSGRNRFLWKLNILALSLHKNNCQWQI